MIWTEFIEGVALAFGGISLVTAGILISLILFVAVDVAVIIAMREKAIYGLLFVDLVLSVLFTVIGWIPVFFGAVVAFIFALIGAAFIRDSMSGGSA